ncbi:MAG TPA: helix-turn-helix domain-containing protein [Caulobacterales bacterium]|nr:helix-turn-helix domain-containing protein [Caulobacterales bacterium]
MSQDLNEDPRAQRTLQALRGAFFDFILNAPRYEDIKVADIIEAAGVGRSTFYEHFQSKDDMLIKSMQPFFDTLAAVVTDAHDPEGLAWVMRHFWDQRRMVGIFRMPATRAIIVRGLAATIERRLVSRGPTRVSAKLVAAQLAEGQLALIVAWLSGQASAPPERLAETLAATSRAAADAAY